MALPQTYTGRAGYFTRTILRGACLVAADLSRARLCDADLTHADLREGRLLGANLTSARLRGARYDAATRWPPGFNPRRHGAVKADR